MTTRTGETVSFLLCLEHEVSALAAIEALDIVSDSDPREVAHSFATCDACKTDLSSDTHPLTVWVEDAPRIKQYLGIALTD